MKTYHPYSIDSFASVCDCKMILDELKHDFRELEKMNNELYADVLDLLNAKMEEVESRYKNK